MSTYHHLSIWGEIRGYNHGTLQKSGYGGTGNHGHSCVRLREDRFTVLQPVMAGWGISELNKGFNWV
jgi:hypothetical protein